MELLCRIERSPKNVAYAHKFRWRVAGGIRLRRLAEKKLGEKGPGAYVRDFQQRPVSWPQTSSMGYLPPAAPFIRTRRPSTSDFRTRLRAGDWGRFF